MTNKPKQCEMKDCTRDAVIIHKSDILVLCNECRAKMQKALEDEY